MSDLQAVLTHGLSTTVAQMDFALSGFRDKLYGEKGAVE